MKNKISSKRVLFPNKRNLGHRNWGSETLLVLIPKILSLKILKMKKGSKGGLQYHHKKNECGYVVSGKLKVKYDTKRPGSINKSVTIFSNAINEPTKVVRIKGSVLPKPASGVPANNSGPANN